MLHPRKVGVALGWRAVFPTHVIFVAVPVAVVERWVGDDVVGFQVLVQVAAERVSVLFAKVAVDALDRDVLHGQSARGGVGFLTVDRDGGFDFRGDKQGMQRPATLSTQKPKITSNPEKNVTFADIIGHLEMSSVAEEGLEPPTRGL